MISANGKTATCAAAPSNGTGGPGQTTWQTYPLPDQRADTGGGIHMYQSTVELPAGYSLDVETLWVSASGSALLGEWTASPPPIRTLGGKQNSPDDSPQPQVHFGVISHGTFTPLPTPTGAFPSPQGSSPGSGCRQTHRQRARHRQPARPSTPSPPAVATTRGLQVQSTTTRFQCPPSSALRYSCPPGIVPGSTNSFVVSQSTPSPAGSSRVMSCSAGNGTLWPCHGPARSSATKRSWQAAAQIRPSTPHTARCGGQDRTGTIGSLYGPSQPRCPQLR
jgi:hypothetical protein